MDGWLCGEEYYSFGHYESSPSGGEDHLVWDIHNEKEKIIKRSRGRVFYVDKIASATALKYYTCGMFQVKKKFREHRIANENVSNKR
jgi:hypothetical protein